MTGKNPGLFIGKLPAFHHIDDYLPLMIMLKGSLLYRVSVVMINWMT